MGALQKQFHASGAGRTVTLKSLLFDMDGTLVDSDPIHASVFIDFLGKRGVSLTEKDYMKRIHGRMNVDIFRDLLPDEDPDEMDRAKEAAYRDRIGASMEPMPGVGALISKAREVGLTLAAVTNGPRANLEAILAATGLAHAFTCTVSSNDVKRGKPDPEPYERALRNLGVRPDEALVFEDSPSGIRSARAAGIEVVGIASSLPASELTRHGAKLAVDDFNDPALWRRLTDPEGAFA